MNFRAGIHVLVKKDDKYLLLRRSNTDKDDKECWDLPGGGIDWGEQPLDAATRETKEETGVNIKVTGLIGAWALEAEKDWSVEFIALGEFIDGDILLSDEHDKYKWVSNEELKNIAPQSVHLKALLDHSINFNL